MPLLRDPQCRRCGLYKNAATVCMSGSGPADAKVILIGEAPGAEEDRSGQPFVGRSGQLLRTEVGKVGITNYRVTNIVRCRPPNNRPPTATEIKACKPFLQAELAKVRPEYVLTLGSPATKAVLKQAKITQAHGQRVELPDFKGMAAFHPAYCLRDPSKTPAFQADIARFAGMVKGDEPKNDAKIRFATLDNMGEMLADLRACEEFAFDTETSSLFPFGPGGRVRCLALATSKCSWVIPLEMPGTRFKGLPTQLSVLYAVRDALKGKSGIAFNGKFDNLWLSIYYDVKFDLSFDVMLAHHILDENQPHDLEYIARQELNVPEYKLTTVEKLSDANPEQLWRYCGLDAAYTLRLKQKFKPLIYDDKALRKVFYRIVMPAARVMEKVEARGLRLDLPRMRQVEKENATALEKTLAELQAMVPPAKGKARRKNETINWNSPQQVATVLYRRLGLKCPVKTDTGADSTGIEALSELGGKHPIVKKLLDYRELEKFRSAYLDGWKPLMVGDRLYPSYKLHGTVSGRYSSRIHQVPRDGSIRNLFIPPEGWDLLQADYSQAELRIAAILSEDPEMLRCYREGIDLHWRYLIACIELGILPEYSEKAIITAHQIRKMEMTLAQALEIILRAGPDRCKEIWKGWKDGRQIAKSANFGFLYTLQPPGFVKYAKINYEVDVTLKQAESLHRTYFSLYRNLTEWHDKYRRLAHLNGQVRTLSGRIRRLPSIRSSDRALASEAERQAINSPVQGFIADLKEMALIELDEKLDPYNAVIVAEVHDAILFYVKKNDEQPKTLQQIRWIMERPKLLQDFGIKLPIPMDVDLTLGRWGAGKIIPRDALVYI